MWLILILNTRAAHWAYLVVRMSIDTKELDLWVYYYRLLADTLKYIWYDICLCIIKAQCSDQGGYQQKRQKGCQNNVYNILSEINWLRIVDKHVVKWASMESQQFLLFEIRQSKIDLVVVIHNWSIGCLYMQKVLQHAPYHILKISVNRESMICSLGSWVIDGW